MEAIFEVIFQIIFEVVFEMLAQVLVELGFESLAQSLRDKVGGNPILAGIGYILFGFILGGLSLLIFPEPIIKGQFIKLINFAASPVLVGLSLCLFSWMMKGRKGEIFQLDKFIFGILFSVSYSFIRFIFTT